MGRTYRCHEVGGKKEHFVRYLFHEMGNDILEHGFPDLSAGRPKFSQPIHSVNYYCPGCLIICKKILRKEKKITNEEYN